MRCRLRHKRAIVCVRPPLSRCRAVASPTVDTGKHTPAPQWSTSMSNDSFNPPSESRRHKRVKQNATSFWVCSVLFLFVPWTCRKRGGCSKLRCEMPGRNPYRRPRVKDDKRGSRQRQAGWPPLKPPPPPQTTLCLPLAGDAAKGIANN